MGLKHKNLDKVTREHMLAEIKRDVDAGSWFKSDNLTPEGLARWPDLLRKAAESENDDWLAKAIQPLLKAREVARATGKSGKVQAPVMRDNAHEMLGEGQFNSYYMRGVCQRTIAEGKKTVTVYRARPVDEERSSSRTLIGQMLDAQAVLDDLRKAPRDQKMGLAKPNSTISVEL